MIRPVTLVTAVAMLGSGAWLFVVKHRAEQLDHRIGHVTAQIRASEQRIRVLRAEWALETDPNRLARLAAMFMPQLKPMTPDQLVSWDQLANRLPPPGTKVPTLPMPPPLPNELPEDPLAAVASNASAAPPTVAPPAETASIAATALPPPPPATPRAAPVAAPVQLAASHPASVHQTRHAPPRRVVRTHPVPKPHHEMPPVREAANRPQRLGASVLAPRPVSRPMGARVMSITAHDNMRVPSAPSPTPVPRQSGPRVVHSSVFGDYGSSLPPPRPVAGEPQ